MKVLVAEDSQSNLLFLKACIEEAGFEVVTAGNGEEAVSMFDQHQPDLVLLDVVMPEIDGIAAAKIIRERTVRQDQWVPIIFISGLDGDEDVVKGLEIGGDDYITKPVSQIVLNAKLHAMRRIYEMQRQLDKANKQLKRLSEYDALTGLANRRKFDDTLQREWKRASRTGGSLAFCMCDVDFFKQYNDTYGHQVGDDALCYVAKALEETIRRPGDLVARYGGEEFAVILPETDLQGALVILEKARKAVEEKSIPHSKSSVSEFLTISAGIAIIEPTKANIETGTLELIRTADEALYQAKKKGRNCIVKSQETPTEEDVPV